MGLLEIAVLETKIDFHSRIPIEARELAVSSTRATVVTNPYVRQGLAVGAHATYDDVG